MTNTAQVTAVTETDNNSANNSAKVIITPTYAVLTVTKSVTPTMNVPYHGQVTYTIVISNMSAVNAVNTTLSDTLPLSTSFSSWITPSGATSTTSSVSWNGQVTASQRITFSFVANHTGANYGETITNTSEVSYANVAITSNTAIFSVAHIITLTLDKNSTTSSPLQPNQIITYTVTITNNGTGTANNVMISDTLPASTTFVSSSVTSGITSFASSLYKWTLGTLVPNSPQTLTFRVMVNSGVASGTNIINMATITSTEVTSPISDTVTDTVRYPMSDLQISKTIVGSSTVLAGNQITYTLRITNVGPDQLNFATVTDTFTGATVSSVVTTTGTTCPQTTPTLVCNLTNVTNTSMITVVFNTSAAYSGTLSNTAVITFGSGVIASDNNNADNQTGNITATVRYRQTDLTISKARVGTGYVSAGQPVTYTLTLTNNGPDDVSVVVTDTFTGTATLNNMIPSSGSCTLGTRSCSLNLAVGTPQLITVVLTTGSFSGTLTNSATISATGSFIIVEVDASNNSSAEITTLVQLPTADIEVSKMQVNTGEIIAGSPVTYSLVMTNHGPDTVNVTLTDTFTGSYASVTYNGACSGSALPFICPITGFTGTKLITVVLTTNSFSGTLTNTANISFTSGVTAVDSVANNNSSTVTTSVRYPTADLQVSKARVGSGSVLPGGQITYTVTITNLGPDRASVTVTDTYTGTTTSVVSSTTSGSCTMGAQPVCSIPNFTNTQTITFVMTTNTGFSGIFSNSAKIGLAVANGTDPNLLDNVSEVITALVSGLDIQLVSKTVDNATPSSNQNITYTVQVRNGGPDDATGLVISDSLPTGLTFVSANTAAGSYDAPSGAWTIGNLTKNSTVQLQITAQVDESMMGQTITNTAVLSKVNEGEMNPTNNSVSRTITVQLPQVHWVSANYAVAENGSGSILIIATLNTTSSSNVTVNYSVTGGSAANGTDYGVTNGTLTFPANTLLQTVTVLITDDVVYEGNETAVLSLSAPNNAVLGIPSSTTLTIVDNEIPPNAAPTAQVNSYNTNQGTALTVAASGVLANDSDPESSPLTAILLTTTSHGTLTFSSNGSFSYTPNIGFIGSDSFSYLANDGVNNSNAATVTIVVQAITPPTAVNDNYTTLLNTPLVISTVLLNDSDPYSLTFIASLVSSPSHGILTFSSNGSFIYTPTLNFVGNDSYVYQIVTTKGSTATATVMINVIDIPTISFSAANYAASEAVGSALITVNLSQAYPVTTTVNYQTTAGTATAGVDYGNVSGQLTFAPNVTMQTFTMPITDDVIDENNETVSLLLSGAVNGVITSTNPATLTITDNDLPPTVSFIANSFTVNESSGAVTITLTLSGTSNSTITVPYSIGNGTATAGSDFMGGSGVVTFTPGMTQVTIVIPIINDGVVESNETFPVTLTGATNATLGSIATTTITIVDTLLPTVQFVTASQIVSENAGGATVPIILSAASANTITVNYVTDDNTALAGSDYRAVSGTLTFTPGLTMLSFNIPITDDLLMEGDELVSLTLSSPVSATLGVPSTALLTIADNDVITVITGLKVFNNSPTLLGQPTTLSATVTAGSGISYTWSLGDGTTGAGNIVLHTYPAGGVYTAVVTASNSLGQLTATTVITIIEPIAGLVLVSDAPTQLGQPTHFSATVTAGNFISYTFDFGDNTAPVILPANWTDGSLTGILLKHTYAASGTYTVTVIASNGLSTMTTTAVVIVVGSTPHAVIDLAVMKQSANPVMLGQAMTYTIVITNLGPGVATNVILTDTLPSQVTLGTQPLNCQGTTSLVCNIGTLTNGETVTMTLMVMPNQVGLMTNTVQVGAAESEVITSNNIATITTTVGHALTLVDSTVGGTLVFTNNLGNLIEVSVSAGPQSVVLLLTEQAGVATIPANYTFADYAFNLAFYQNGQLLPNYVMTTPVNITLQNAVISSTNLVLMYQNSNGQWVDAATVCNPPSRYTIDPVAHTMQITVCHISSNFALFTKLTPSIYLPIILRSEPVIVTPTPTSTTPTPTPTPTVGSPQADLISSFSLNPTKTNFTAGELVAITVVVTNQGTVAAGPFWVDFFINPSTAPQNGSFVWNEQCTLSPCYGLAWQVLGLAPGQSITLNSTASSYSSQHTKWSGLFINGTHDLYLYVDTWSANRSPLGAVLESNETNNRAELHGLVVTGARNGPIKPFSLELPERDLPH